MVEPAEERDPVETLAEEFLIRRRRGEHPTISEYVAANPALADGIRAHFPTVLMLEQFKSCTQSSAGLGMEQNVEPPAQLGDFRLIRQIGRGGMGSVYEAEQESLQRHVAVKVFPQSRLRDESELKRFHREAQTAARLHHTNIVPVFGVGQQDGWHYFVMQQINGLSLEQVIRQSGPHGDSDSDARPLAHRSFRPASPRFGNGNPGPPVAAAGYQGQPTLHETPGGERIVDLYQQRREWKWVADLGIQVAEAIAFAHAHGVLHRDIKPGNLLLDPQGVIWVTDFGLATLMQSDEFKESGKVAGTLRFMAPEQIQGEPDVRSDIYSLGLTLYELVTRVPAFETGSRVRLFEKIVKGDLAPPHRFRHSIPRDLEAIILKSISLDPARRYQSADALAADLGRFVEGRPVEARRIGSGQRLLQWARRSPAIASLTAALLLLFLLSIAVVSEKWREAVAERRRAEKNLSLALESMDHILARFTSSWMADPNPIDNRAGELPDPTIGFQMVVSNHNAAVLEDALNFYDEFARQNPTDPRLQRDIAKVHERVGEIYIRLGQFERAQDAYERALNILETQAASDSLPLILERARTHNQIGLTYHAKSQFRDAEYEYERARRLLDDVNKVADPECRTELARTLTNLGHSQWLMLQPERARESHRQAIGLLESVAEEFPENVRYRLALAKAYRSYHPLVATTKGGLEEAERMRLAGVSILEQLVENHPAVPDYQCELCEMLAVTSYSHGRFRRAAAEGERLHRASQIARNLHESHPSVPQYRALLAKTLKELARVRLASDPELAEQMSSESLALHRGLVREFSDIPAYRILLAMALQDHAEMLRRLGRDEQVRSLLEEGVDQQKIYVQMRPENRLGRSVLARLYGTLAHSPRAGDEPDEL